MSNVEYLTNDALMYLLAIIKNVKVKYNSAGNLPKNQECKKIVTDSGFLNYVNTNKAIEITKTTNKLQIQAGNTIDIVVAKNICDFMINDCGMKKNECRFLYDIIIELMTNTYQHAYNNNNMLLSYWYVFVEKEREVVKFTFLDTGEGIPQTIKKKWFEKMKLLEIKTDSEFINAALNEKFRSRTAKNYRGKGLPKIYKYYLNDKIKNLKIISRYGIFESNFSDKTLKEKLQGTLFSWEVSIEKLSKEENINVENNNI